MHEREQFLERTYFELKNKDVQERLMKLVLLSGTLISLNACVIEANREENKLPFTLQKNTLQYGLINQEIIDLLNSTDLIVDTTKDNSNKALLAHNMTKSQIDAFDMLFRLFFENRVDRERDSRMEKWKLYANHIHSEELSDKQTDYYKEKRAMLKEILYVLSINTQLTAKLCVYLVDKFPCAREKYKEIKRTTNVQIEQWYI